VGCGGGGGGGGGCGGGGGGFLIAERGATQKNKSFACFKRNGSEEMS